MFPLLVEVRFLPFYEHRFLKLYLSLTWYLVAAESRISKQSGVKDVRQNSELCRCLKTFEDLSESTRTLAWRNVDWFHQYNKHYNSSYTRKFINHTLEKPLRDSIFHIKKIRDFESSQDKPYINSYQ